MILIAAEKTGGLSSCELWMSVYPKPHYPTGVTYHGSVKILSTQSGKDFLITRRTGRPEHAAKYKKLHIEVVSNLRKSKSDFFNKLKSNSKEFWKAINKIVQNNNLSIPILTGNISSDIDKANAHFSNCFNPMVLPLYDDDISTCNPGDCPEDLLCCDEEVLALLKHLEVKKASGMDGISAHMLKATAHSIALAITQLFNISIRLGRIPDAWKAARVTPIPKGGDANDPNNYRPISLLPIINKLLERHNYVCSPFKSS